MAVTCFTNVTVNALVKFEENVRNSCDKLWYHLTLNVTDISSCLSLPLLPVFSTASPTKRAVSHHLISSCVNCLMPVSR